MVSFTSIIVAAAAAFALTAPAVSAVDCSTYPVGEYCRPYYKLVSGKPGATTRYRRSPCPAINTLANHGHLPRDGRNVSRTVLRDVVMDKFNLDLGLANFVTSLVPETFDLDLLGTHGLIEHDASLARSDIYFGADPAFATGPLLEDLFSRASKDKPYTIETLGKLRKDRLEECQKINPTCTFSGQDSFLAFGEAAFVVNLFGNGNNTASLSNVRSFFAEEKFPKDYAKPTTALSIAGLTAISAQIQAAAV